MQLTAIFETWHFGDGNYPPLQQNELVNLSFELQPNSLSKCSPDIGRFEQIEDANYRFNGTVLKIYGDLPRHPLVIVQAGNFKFYMDSFSKEVSDLKEGDGCTGSGCLMLDYYIWVEFRETYRDTPNLLYPLRVTRIRSVKIPDEMVSRFGNTSSGPTSLCGPSYPPIAVTEVTRMTDAEESWQFYLVDLDDSDIGGDPVPQTFGTSSV